MPDNPIATSELNEIKLPKDLPSQISDEGDNALNDRTQWEDKLVISHRNRFGIRGEKTFPWPNASNLSIPMIDKTIRRLKPNFVNLVMASRPIASFDPVDGGEDMGNARRAESMFDWLLRTHMPEFETNLFRGSDYLLEKGFFIWKCMWDYQTRTVTETHRRSEIPPEDAETLLDPETPVEEAMQYFADRLDLDRKDDADDLRRIVTAFRNGDDKVSFEKEEAFINRPKVLAVQPEDLLVPANTTDIETSRLLVHRIWLNKNDLKIKERDGIYENVDKANPASSGSNDDEIIDTEKSAREGVTPFKREEDIYEIWECYFWHDIDGDGVQEKVVMTMDKTTETVLRFIELPFEHGEWPFVQVRFEETDDRYYSSRGIPEMLKDISEEINHQHNAKIDRGTIANTPMLLTRPNIRGHNIKFIPGQRINVNRPDDIVPFQFPIIDPVFEREEQILKAWGDEYMGSEAGLTAGPLSGTGEARTATEVSSIQQSFGRIFALDGRIFQLGMKKLYQQIWANWMQFGPEDVWVRTMNSEPIRMTRHEIQGQFDIRPSGTSDNTNPALEAQKAVARMQLLTGHPLVRQAELVRDYLEKDDMRIATRLLKTDQEIQQEQQAQQQAIQEGPASVDEAIQALRMQKTNGASQVQG